MITRNDGLNINQYYNKTFINGSYYSYPTLIEPVYNGNGGSDIKDYRVVGQDGSFPNSLFYGTFDECVKWRLENCL